MKIWSLFLLLIISTGDVSSNTFSHTEASPRFHLKISKTAFDYRSELLHKKLLIKDCNRSLIHGFNGSLISFVSSSQAKKGIAFQLDNRTFIIDPKSKFANQITEMDIAITSLLFHENQLCK